MRGNIFFSGTIRLRSSTPIVHGENRKSKNMEGQEEEIDLGGMRDRIKTGKRRVSYYCERVKATWWGRLKMAWEKSSTETGGSPLSSRASRTTFTDI